MGWLENGYEMGVRKQAVGVDDVEREEGGDMVR